MLSLFVSRAALAAALTVGAINCTAPPAEDPPPPGGEARGGMFLHGQAREKLGAEVKTTSAPPGAHLQYFGGRIVSNVQVVQVIYGAGSYIPQVTSTASPSMATFYQGVLNSAHVDWLTEYNTNTQPPPNSNQTLGRGSFLGQATITPSAANNGTVIDDLQIQAELTAQIRAGNIPGPSHDALGNNNTYYALFFPHGKTITLGGAASCQVFCAYHGTIVDNAPGGPGEIYYGVHPDFQPGSGCELGCGAAQTQFGNYTQVASHELVETMTDPEVGLATVFGPPLAWADLVFSEIGDICNDQNGHVVGSDGITYDVQTEFSNTQNDCIVTGPQVNPLLVNSPGETCRGSTATATVTVLGGAGRFVDPVTLSLGSVSPPPAPGGEITATFDPNPVPTPPTNGSPSAMRIATTALTPPGTYTLAVQASSAGLSSTTTTSFVVRSEVPAPTTLVAPLDGADGAPAATSFSWTPVSQATSYSLEVFDGPGCAGPAIRSFQTGGTSFTLPTDQALPAFQTFSWHVSASNSCGGNAQVSACFSFRTASCSTPQDVITNGGFETGLTGWNVDQAVPPPVVGGDNPHTGAQAVLLGSLVGGPEPLGDVQISQILTLDAGSNPKLTFSEWPLTTDSVTFDQQYVRVTPISPPGPTVVLMNEARNDRTYIARSFDLSAFAGSTIKLTFGVHQDGFGDVTAMFLDDISVTTQRCGPPDFVVKVTPPAPEEVCAGNVLSFAVSVDSVNGPNFTSPVTLGTAHLPPGATATFANNPLSPGESTTMTLVTTRPTPGGPYHIDVTGVAVTPPPAGTRTTTTTVVVDANPPSAPEIVSPRTGEVNVPRRPTLAWTAPFVPDSATSSSPASASPAQRGPFLWELAGTRAPKLAGQDGVVGVVGMAPSGPGSGASPTPFAFGAQAYHLQIARDAGFTSVVIDVQVSDTSFTVPVDLDIATQYFWRVSATNTCGGSAFSATGSFVVGACFEGWAQAVAIPVTAGPSQASVVAVPSTGKLYVIGGGTGVGPDTRIDQLWAFDPESSTWTRKADVPSPGIGANFGSAVELGGKIYAFGGVIGPPGPITVTRTLWRYDIASDTWSRGADLPVDNFGAAVGAMGGKIYIAYGSGFLTQTWQYDPATDTYTRKADAPNIATTNRVHGAVLGGELHAFAGGFEGNAHVIYNPVTNAWRSGPPMPFTATDPAVGVLGGRAFVVGGRPVARTQIFDPATGTWSQGAPITGAPTGVDNTAGAALGATFHLVGGFNGTTSVSTHWQFHACNLGGLSSATFLPFVVDGNGKVAGIGNERTALLLDNAINGAPLSVSCFLFGTNGNLLGSDTIQVAPNELKTVSDVVRALTHTTGVQNVVGSVALFGTDVFHGMASVVNNVTADPVLVDGQPLSGGTAGFVSTIGSESYKTQTVFANTTAGTALLQLVAYPSSGGDTPVAASVAFVPPHGLVSYPDAVKQLGLATGFSGQLTWSSNRAMSVMARDVTASKNFSGLDPAHAAADARSAVLVPYVEDTDELSTALEISNPGSFTANVTVHLFEAGDATGGSSGVESTRDIAVPVNSAAPIADIVRWVRRDPSTSPSGKRGFIVVTTPQAVTAQARLVDRASGDPAVPESSTPIATGFSPVLVRVDPFAFASVDAAAATPATSRSRFALSNPGPSTATVQLVATNATGSPATGVPFTVTLAPNGQFFSDNLAFDMGLPPIFLGSVTVHSDVPVLVYNQRMTGDGGATVPVHGQ
ncbi:MAG TPA: kelch repeat-containing protein [Kofleriaceae bacterium]|nr:kelch repeat-containing protein [Kofleriaceae bacterium]